MARLLRRQSSLYHSQRPSQEHVDPPQSTEVLSGKLPYACRDFRNGQCYRGEKCRFMHVYDSKNDLVLSCFSADTYGYSTSGWGKERLLVVVQ